MSIHKQLLQWAHLYSMFNILTIMELTIHDHILENHVNRQKSLNVGVVGVISISLFVILAPFNKKLCLSK